MNINHWSRKAILFIIIFNLTVFFTGCLTNEKFEKETSTEYLNDLNINSILTVGSAVPYAPMEFFNETGDIDGFDIDIIKTIASRLNLTIEIIDYDFGDLLDAIKNDEIDVGISSLTITHERSKEMLFSDPYFNGGQVIVTLKNNTDIITSNSLDGKWIAVQNETTCEEAALEYFDSDYIIHYTSTDNYPTDLIQGKFDAFIIDYIAGFNFAKEYEELTLVGDPFTQEYYGIATAKSNDALIKEINNILRDMKKDGTFNALEEKWINV